jgi:hypothetical protein
MDVENGVAAPGSIVQIWSCTNLVGSNTPILAQTFTTTTLGVFSDGGVPLRGNYTTTATTIVASTPTLSVPPAVTPTLPPGPAVGSAQCDQELGHGTYKPRVVPEYIFIGARGSSEKELDGRGTGMGTRMEFLYDSLRANRKFSNILCAGMISPQSWTTYFFKDKGFFFKDKYRASDATELLTCGIFGTCNWLPELIATKMDLTSRIISIAELYPKSKLIIAGYSQGAILVQLALQELANPTKNRLTSLKVSNVILVADPLGNSKETLVGPRGSKNWLETNGSLKDQAMLKDATPVRPLKKFAQRFNLNVVSICHKDDIVCNWPGLKDALPWNLNILKKRTGPHSESYNREAPWAKDLMASVIAYLK